MTNAKIGVGNTGLSKRFPNRDWKGSEPAAWKAFATVAYVFQRAGPAVFQPPSRRPMKNLGPQPEGPPTTSRQLQSVKKLFGRIDRVGQIEVTERVEGVCRDGHPIGERQAHVGGCEHYERLRRPPVRA